MPVDPASRELVVHKPVADVHRDLLGFISLSNGDVETVHDSYVEATFGSAVKTTLKGAGVAGHDDLPKKLEAYLEADGDGTKLRLLVRASQRFGTWGAEKRYEDALSSFADRVVTAMVT